MFFFLINVPSQFDFYFPLLDFEYETKKKNPPDLNLNECTTYTIYTYVALDRS